MKKLAITGGISCGKSTACRFLRELGAYVVSADEVVHQLLSPDTSLGQRIVSLLGAEIIVDGTFDRQIIASKVFNHKDRLEALEALIHPAVREDISKQFKEVAALGVHPLFVAEIPLLFEAGFEYEYDYTAAIIADEAECQRRFQAARGYDGEEYARRASRQWSPQEKAAKADFVIPNGGDENQLKHAVRELYEKIVT